VQIYRITFFQCKFFLKKFSSFCKSDSSLA